MIPKEVNIILNAINVINNFLSSVKITVLYVLNATKKVLIQNNVYHAKQYLFVKYVIKTNMK
jgi:hypothetical protein